MKIVNTLLFLFIALFAACEQNQQTTQVEQKAIIEQAITERHEEISKEQDTLQEEMSPTNVEATIPSQNVASVDAGLDNKQYLFDVSSHSLEDLENLLARAEKISTSQDEQYDELEIVIILHGPDINWFNQNLPENERLIDLAKELDDKNIIDLRVCDRSIEHHGYSRSNIPEFIESVPFGPTEIQTRLDEGYINL